MLNPLWGVVDLFDARYRRIVAPAIPRIIELIGEGLTPERAVAKAFAEFGIQPEIRDAVLDSMVHSAAIAFGVALEDLPAPAVLSMRRAFLDKSWPGDSVTFSERIIGGEVRAAAVSEIRTQLAAAASFKEFAKGLSDPLGLNGRNYVKAELPAYIDRVARKAQALFNDTPTAQAVKEFNAALRAAKRTVAGLASSGAPTQTLKAIYSDILKAAETLDQKKLEKAVQQGVRDKARYNAERIARTEIARAYGEAFDLKNNENPDTIGCRFKLSSRHPYPCICNFWTSANLYGMGPGVYPKDLLPEYPFHPHCLCLKEEVFKGEAVRSTTLREQEAITTLMNLNEEDRARIMGKGGAEEFARDPRAWKSLLQGYADPAPWKPKRLTDSHRHG